MKWLYCAILCVFFNSITQAQTRSLNYYLDFARASSPLLKDLRNQNASSSLDSLRLRASLKAQVNGTSSGLYAPTIGDWGYASAITNGQTFDAVVGVNKAIISKANLNAQFASITLTKDSLTNAVQLSEQDLKRAITAQYITAYGDLQQLRFTREVVDLLSKEEQVLKQLTRANTYKQADYLTFLVTLKQQQLQVFQARLA